MKLQEFNEMIAQIDLAIENKTQLVSEIYAEIFRLQQTKVLLNKELTIGKQNAK